MTTQTIFATGTSYLVAYKYCVFPSHPCLSAVQKVLDTFPFPYSLPLSLESAINFANGCSSTPVQLGQRPTRTIFSTSPFSVRFFRLKRAKEDLCKHGRLWKTTSSVSKVMDALHHRVLRSHCFVEARTFST